MDNKALWQRYREFYQFFPKVGISLDISRMRFPDSFWADLSEKTNKAFGEMKALESGVIANPDENRMVGHYWLRASNLAPTKSIQEEIEDSNSRILKFAENIHNGSISPTQSPKFNNILLIGIGGSALGPQLISQALHDNTSPMKIFFLDNTDPDGIALTLGALGDELGSTLVIVISKSGGTAETRNGYLHVKNIFEKNNLDFSRHAVAITGNESKLDKIAKEDSWIARFPMWDWVGGRTSIFSAVGILPAALQGIPTDEFLAGAAAMDEITRIADAKKNPAMLLALMWFFAGDGQGSKDMVILPYKDRLVLFSKYLQQLVMESVGKEKNLKGEIVNQGIAVYGNKGSTDQHAYVQQLRDGINNFFATFIQVLNDTSGIGNNSEMDTLEVEPNVTAGDYLRGFLIGTRAALYENKRDSITISLDSLTPHSMGALIALYERAVGFYASLVNVNAYHQPGVEAGKKAASRVIEIQGKLLENLRNHSNSNTSYSSEELANAIDADDEAETVYMILEHLASNASRNIERTGARGPSTARYSLKAKL